jgi:hypothetical protein
VNAWLQEIPDCKESRSVNNQKNKRNPTNEITLKLKGRNQTIFVVSTESCNLHDKICRTYHFPDWFPSFIIHSLISFAPFCSFTVQILFFTFNGSRFSLPQGLRVFSKNFSFSSFRRLINVFNFILITSSVSSYVFSFHNFKLKSSLTGKGYRSSSLAAGNSY